MAQKISFYTDEHVANAVVHGLWQRGVDVLTVADAGLLGAGDEEHAARARAEGRVLFTQDPDFLRLHAAGVVHAGIVYAPQGTPIGDIIRGLMLIYQVLEPDEMTSHVEFLQAGSLLVSTSMRSALHGKPTSEIEVTNVSTRGFWLLIESREIFVPLEEFPWFREALIGQLVDVELQSPEHLYWPKLDVDLAVESLEHPERYPLVSRMLPRKRLQAATAHMRERGPRYKEKGETRRGLAARPSVQTRARKRHSS